VTPEELRKGLNKMADEMIDFAIADTPAVADSATVDTPTTEVDTTSTDSATVDTPTTEVDTPSDEGKETELKNADGTDKTPEEQEAFKTAAAAKADSDKALEATPADVRKALKGLRDADPKNADIVKQLHGSYERWNAAKAVFPKGVAEMQEAKAFIESIGGPEGYQKTQELINQVTATDELLYAADAKLWDNVIEDLKANGHPESLGALAPSFLEKLKAHDPDGYYDAFKPHFFEGLKASNMGAFVAQFNDALVEKDQTGAVKPNLDKITKLVAAISNWYSDTEKEAKEKTAAPADTPERKKFLAEKAAFEKTRTEESQRKQKDFETGVATDCDKKNNTILGKVLGGFLKMPFFKDFPYDTKVDLGNGIKDRLYAALKADKAYQIQMDAMWKQKTPDRAKMIQYHEAKVQAIAQDIVTKTVQNRYPGYAKGGSAAGKAAAAVVKKETATKAATQSVATGKPIYVASRPDNIVREAIKVGGKDYSASDLITLQIAGRGFVKSADGKSVKFVTWRK
jgi:hypothetical protein